MTTNFCNTQVVLSGEYVLTVDGNSKVDPTLEGYDNPKPMVFSLPAPSCCPGSTSVCRESCYVRADRFGAFEGGLMGMYRDNERTIHKILAVGNYRTAIEFGQWIEENAAFGFRWHTSGDIFSKDYLHWLRLVCDNSLNVQHWLYTRSLWAVEELACIDNLHVNLSCDAENWEDVHLMVIGGKWKTFGGRVRLCYMVRKGSPLPDLPKGSVIFPEYSLRKAALSGHGWFESLSKEQRRMVCAADYYGQSENHRCATCRRCFTR